MKLEVSLPQTRIPHPKNPVFPCGEELTVRSPYVTEAGLQAEQNTPVRDGEGQAGWSSEQPGLVEDVPAHGRGVGTR